MEPAGTTSPEFTKKNLIDVIDGVQAVRDDDFGCFRGKLGEDFFENLFGDSVDIGSRLIQDQKLWPAERRAHECDQLLLSQADAVAAAGDFRRETLGEA
ncbi:MAG: hypothetical protein WDO18_21535 [Acidobacteriota bacterium]